MSELTKKLNTYTGNTNSFNHVTKFEPSKKKQESEEFHIINNQVQNMTKIINLEQQIDFRNNPTEGSRQVSRKSLKNFR